MGCRCSDIPRMQRDIGRMDTILQHMTRMTNTNDTITGGLSTLEGNTAGAVTPDNLFCLCSTIWKFNQDFQQDVTAAAGAYIIQRAAMSVELAAMHIEDAAAHRDD